MTKSSVRKAAPRNTHRNTTRKIGARKAHSGDRKTTSKVATEKARGTYRKTAARFEELAYDGQMPESMRALAENSVALTRELYTRSFEAVLGGWESFLVAAGQGSVALNRKAIDIARRNINAGFGLAQRLAGARNLAEAMELQATYWRKQLGELSSQAGEMRTLSTKVTADVAAPIKAQVTRGMRGLHKAT
jgi:phasin family protein